ncbi:MAG TPA: glucose-6-phosphate dehydrogenase, partial [Clostridiaceae bacterium]|nr:glucose-6-phosphate dehydrogenase [Clostridiaceae bacterium]
MASTKRFSTRNLDDESFETFSRMITYFRLDFNSEKDYERLLNELNDRDQDGILDNYMFYLAVSPDYFTEIVENLKTSRIRKKKSNWQRLIIEKPFG